MLSLNGWRENGDHHAAAIVHLGQGHGPVLQEGQVLTPRSTLVKGWYT